MTLPNISLTITDGALGLSQENVDRIIAMVGPCSGGSTGTIYPLTSPQDAVSNLGYGPLPEAAAYHLQTAGGVVYAVKATTATNGGAAAVASVPASPTGHGVLTVTGTPYDRYDVRVLIVTGGENGTATFKYSLDDGDTYSDVLNTGSSPYSYAIANTGMTLVFTSGSGTDWVAGEYYYFHTRAPEAGANNIGTAIDTLLADSREWRCLHIVGDATPYATSTSYSVCTTADTKMDSAEAKYRYTYAVAEARDIGQGGNAADSFFTESEATWISSVAAGTAAFESPRVSLVGGTCKLQSAISLPGRTYARRSVAWPILAQRIKLSKSDDSGWVAKTGGMPGVAALYHNEESTPGLDTARLTTARTLVGVNGYYCTHMRMMSSATSDFRFVQYREVMDEACRLARLGMLKFLNAKLRVDSRTGYIDVRDAIAIEQYVGGLVNAGLSGEISDASIAVARTDNILSTQTLRTTLRIKPMAYAKYISVDLGFTNPALTFEAA